MSSSNYAAVVRSPEMLENYTLKIIPSDAIGQGINNNGFGLFARNIPVSASETSKAHAMP